MIGYDRIGDGQKRNVKDYNFDLSYVVTARRPSINQLIDQTNYRAAAQTKVGEAGRPTAGLFPLAQRLWSATARTSSNLFVTTVGSHGREPPRTYVLLVEETPTQPGARTPHRAKLYTPYGACVRARRNCGEQRLTSTPFPS